MSYNLAGYAYYVDGTMVSGQKDVRVVGSKPSSKLIQIHI